MAKIFTSFTKQLRKQLNNQGPSNETLANLMLFARCYNPDQNIEGSTNIF